MSNPIPDQTQLVPVERELVDEYVLWTDPNVEIWRAKHFSGVPSFYPVYQCGQLYSYSPLNLLLHKGTFVLNERTARETKKRGFRYAGGRETLDREIVRIGAPRVSSRQITDGHEYATRSAAAMVLDVHEIEERFPDYLNIVLCGGKDSLNLLLLPWKNPVLAMSAEPNYPLVKDFVRRNGLDIEVERLEDDEHPDLQAEILANMCRCNLEHCRWGGQLRSTALAHDKKVIFWKGQLGSIIYTPKWRYYIHPRRYEPFVKRIPRWLQYPVEATEWRQRHLARNLWLRGAAWQGAHLSMLRRLTGALVLGGYHGPRTSEIWAAADFHRAVSKDLRPDMGHALRGEPIWYPSANPSPPLSVARRGASSPEAFLRALDALRREGLNIAIAPSQTALA